VGFDSIATPVDAGPCRLFVGKRSDPFFADAEGVLHWLAAGQPGLFEWTGTDTFGAANILSIVVDAPNDMLGSGPEIGVWITVSLRRDGALVQMDRGGNPSFNPILNADDIKDGFNSTDPVDDVKNYLKPCRNSSNGMAMHRRKPRLRPAPCCPTSFTTTAPCRPTTPTAGSRPTTSSPPG
jgi:Domain of unknown function (DUF4331)